MKHQHNPGCGKQFCFHGAWLDKADAQTKEGAIAGAFIKPFHYGQETRYAVLTRRWRKKVSDITDRQRRERSRQTINPQHMKRCGFCGHKRNMRVHHINGNEADIDERNLMGACHACNLKVAAVMRAHGLGRKADLDQMNPAAPATAGAKNLAAWVIAVKVLRGESGEMKVKDAVALIHATPPARRSRFAEDIWKIRRAKGTDRPGSTAFSFGRNPRTGPQEALLLGSKDKVRRAKAIDWMQQHADDYPSAQMLAQDASSRFDFPVSGLLPAARQFLPPSRKNPLFTRRQKRKMRQKVRGAVRRGILRAFGVEEVRMPGERGRRVLTPRKTNGVRGDVISALEGQGFSRKRAEHMTPAAAPGEGFTSLFKRALTRRNPEMSQSEKDALKFFRGFHGHDPDRVIQMEATIVEAGDYAKVGDFWGYDLAQFPVQPFGEVRPNILAEGSGIKLCGGNIEEIDGRPVAHQLFVLGGNQDLEWALRGIFGVTSGAQFLDLGEIKNIWYIAKKKADGFKRLYYHHTFGEEEKSPAARRQARPILMYDRVHKKQFIVGGSYDIPLEGIRN